MANQQLMAIFSLLLLLCLASTSVAQNEESASKDERKISVAVEGMVYCQSCEQRGTWSLTDAKPIPSAKVSIVCTDSKNRASYYKVAVTDMDGYFYEILEGFTMKHYLLDHPLHACTVHPVSSPLANCNLVTNINYGLDGAPLRYQNKRTFGTYDEIILYSGGPLAFRPAVC